MGESSRKQEYIDSLEFKKRVDFDPQWAKNLDYPVLVKGYVNMKGSKIKSLSKWLRFMGSNEDGECANFSNCKSLKTAEGTFNGAVDFSHSNIERIRRLKVLGVDRWSWSAYFHKCPKLNTLSGEFYGPVAAAESGIECIQNLKIDKKNQQGEKLDLSCNPVSKVGPNISLIPKEIVWDEHLDDDAKNFVTEALQLTPMTNSPTDQGSILKDPTFVTESKKVVVKTIAEAIGADDLLVQQRQPITSPKRQRFLRISTLLAAVACLFLYKTGEELTKQMVIDPTVAAIKNTTSLILDGGKGKNKEISEGKISTTTLNTIEKGDQIWPNEFTPALQRYARSQKTEEDKMVLARDTILVMGLKPESLVLVNDTLTKLQNKTIYPETQQVTSQTTAQDKAQNVLDTLTDFDTNKELWIKELEDRISEATKKPTKEEKFQHVDPPVPVALGIE
jgi:hypothetical protein